MIQADYDLFLLMQHFLIGRRFESLNVIEETCQEFFVEGAAIIVNHVHPNNNELISLKIRR